MNLLDLFKRRPDLMLTAGLPRPPQLERYHDYVLIRAASRSRSALNRLPTAGLQQFNLVRIERRLRLPAVSELVRDGWSLLTDFWSPYRLFKGQTPKSIRDLTR